MWGWGNQPVVFGAEHPVRNRVMFTLLNSLHSFAGIFAGDISTFKRYMKGIWFRLYPGDAARDPQTHTTCNFEHTFMGEVKDTPGYP